MSESSGWILAFDASMNGCGVCLRDPVSGTEIFESRDMPRGQAEVLVPMICEVLARAAVSFSGISCLVTTRGPGAFTGVRIGLSCARTLAVAPGIPAAGIETLTVIARGAVCESEGKKEILAVLDSKRGDFFTRLFDPGGDPLTGPAVMTDQEIRGLAVGRDLLCVGDGVLAPGLEGLPRCAEPSRHLRPDVRVLARMAGPGMQAGAETLRPVYLRQADVSAPRPAFRTICG